jgi:hypothetical protein
MSMLPFRLPRALDSSSSDSDTDGAKATWKATPEDSKPKHQQVQRSCSVNVDNNTCHATLFSAFPLVHKLGVCAGLLLQPHTLAIESVC